MILKTIISSIEFFNIDFYINSMNIIIIIMIFLTRLNFYNFIFLIIKNALIKIIKKTLFYLYSKSVSNFTLRDKRTNINVIL